MSYSLKSYFLFSIVLWYTSLSIPNIKTTIDVYSSELGDTGVINQFSLSPK